MTEDQIRISAISPRVNSPENNDPGIIDPIRIDLTDVEPGSFVEGDGGGLLNLSGAVIARIEGTNSGLFSVVGLEGFRLVKEPDAPGRDWESVGSVDGAGPITVGPKEFLS